MICDCLSQGQCVPGYEERNIWEHEDPEYDCYGSRDAAIVAKVGSISLEGR